MFVQFTDSKMKYPNRILKGTLILGIIGWAGFLHGTQAALAGFDWKTVQTLRIADLNEEWKERQLWKTMHQKVIDLAREGRLPLVIWPGGRWHHSLVLVGTPEGIQSFGNLPNLSALGRSVFIIRRQSEWEDTWQTISPKEFQSLREGRSVSGKGRPVMAIVKAMLTSSLVANQFIQLAQEISLTQKELSRVTKMSVQEFSREFHPVIRWFRPEEIGLVPEGTEKVPRLVFPGFPSLVLSVEANCRETVISWDVRMQAIEMAWRTERSQQGGGNVKGAEQGMHHARLEQAMAKAFLESLTDEEYSRLVGEIWSPSLKLTPIEAK